MGKINEITADVVKTHISIWNQWQIRHIFTLGDRL